MNVHLVKWGRVGFCMQTYSFSTPRIRGGWGEEGRGREQRGAPHPLRPEVSAGAGGGRGRRRLPFGGAQGRGCCSAAGPRVRPPGKGALGSVPARVPPARVSQAGGMSALCIDPHSMLTRKPVTRYV